MTIGLALALSISTSHPSLVAASAAINVEASVSAQCTGQDAHTKSAPAGSHDWFGVVSAFRPGGTVNASVGFNTTATSVGVVGSVVPSGSGCSGQFRLKATVTLDGPSTITGSGELEPGTAVSVAGSGGAPLGSMSAGSNSQNVALAPITASGTVTIEVTSEAPQTAIAGLTFNFTPAVGPALTIGDVADLAPATGATVFHFPVTLSATVQAPVTVSYGSQDGTAHAGTDYEVATGVVTLSPGQTSATIDVTVLGGVKTASPLTFSIVLSNPTNATLAKAAGLGSILTACIGPKVLKGIVVDGAPTDGHQNPLRGIRVQLWRDNAPVGEPVVTAADGSYCVVPEEGVTDPGPYQLRATLVDAAHNPPLFETRYATEIDPVFVEVAVGASDFGGPEKDIAFTAAAAVTSSVERNLADIANIHYQSERFISWVIEKLGIVPATLGSVIITTFDAAEGCTCYTHSTRTVHILPVDSPFSNRDEATDNAPEAIEWHELSHHLEFAVGIASVCVDQANHAGWLNSSSCDSLQEGFAEFLPTIASLDIDAAAGQDYATPAFGVFGSLEFNSYVPWSTSTVPGGAVYQREELAIAQLLWDLADDTPTETDTIDSLDPANPVDHFVHGTDTVALGGIALTQALIAARPQTIADIFATLQASAAVPAQLTAKTVDISGDGKADSSPLEEVFLLHDFHPVHDMLDPGYTQGDPVSRTDHVPDPTGALAHRDDIPLVPGSAIRFINESSSAETFSLDVTDVLSASHFSIIVPAHSNSLIHLEIPPYWRQLLAPGAALPACGGHNQRVETIKLSGPDVESRSLDSCEYLHSVAKATGGAALTFGGTAAPFTTGGGSPIVIVVVLGLALLGVIALTSSWAIKRRGAKKMPG